ncbi:MAG: transglutaminaseTgpA domain-containing protein [Candidatus Methylacidiphilales bacterium]
MMNALNLMRSWGSRARRWVGPDFMGAFGLPVLERGQVVLALWCFALAVLPHISHLTWWVTGLAVVVLWWRLRALRSQWRLPPPIFFAGCILVVMVGVWWSYGTLIGRDGGTALLVGFFGLKILELGNRKDFMVVTGVSFALILAGVLHSQSPLMCLILGFQFLFTTGCLFRIHGDFSGLKMREILKRSGRLVGMSLPLAAIWFVLFPRLDVQLRFSPFDPPSGFADSMSPGSIAGGFSDRGLAFRVYWIEGDPVAMTDLYWRGVTLTRTSDGMAWEQERRNTLEAFVRLPVEGIDLPEDAVRYRVEQTASFQRWVYTLDRPLWYPEATEAKDGEVAWWPSKIRSRVQYEVVSAVQGTGVPLSEEERVRCLALPDSEVLGPRVVELVNSWRAGAEDREVVERMMSFFREEGFAYTFYPGRYSQRRPLETFLFERKRGFCEHYAGAATTLLRMAGIPSRVVLGFQGGEWNEPGQFLLVRKQNAHSWVEAWMEGAGWVRVDPTSVVMPERLSRGMRFLEGWLGRGITFSIAGREFSFFRPGWLPEPWRMQWDAWMEKMDYFNQKWDRWLGYDYGTQVRLMEGFGVTRSPRVSMLGILSFLMALMLGGLFFLRRRPSYVTREEDRLIGELERRLIQGAGTEAERSSVEGVKTYLERMVKIWPESQAELESISSLYHDLKYRELPAHHSSHSLKELAQRVRGFHVKRLLSQTRVAESSS